MIIYYIYVITAIGNVICTMFFEQNPKIIESEIKKISHDADPANNYNIQTMTTIEVYRKMIFKD